MWLLATRLSLLISLWLLVSAPNTLAQLPVTLTLQPHKLQLAQRLCREGITKKKPMVVAEGYYEYGKLYAAASDYLNAHRWFLKALRLLETRGNTYELARVHVRLADLAFTQNQYPESFFHAYQALGIGRLSKSDRALIRSFSLLARLHARNWATESKRSMNWPTANPDSAIYYFRKVEFLAYRLNDPMEVAHVKQDIGNQLVARDDRRSLVYMTEALAIANRQKSSDRPPMMLSVASAYIRIGQLKKAWFYITRAQQLVHREYPNVVNTHVVIEHTLVDFYSRARNWKQVVLHKDKIYQWEKRSLLADREGIISRMHLEYQTEKKQLMIKAQQATLVMNQKKLQLQQWVILATSTLLLVFIGISILFFSLFRQKRRLSILNAQLVNEQNHRVKNNLQVVSSLLSLQANRLTDEVARKAIQESQLRVESMAILHRRLYEENKQVHINLSDFLEEVVETVLQSYGYGHVQPIYELEPLDLSADQSLALGLLVNELTTNACKYAFPGQEFPVYKLACQRRGALIRLVVLDNGPGLLTDLNRKSGNSFGMRLIQIQATQLWGSFQYTYQNGTVFTLTFPY